MPASIREILQTREALHLQASATRRIAEVCIRISAGWLDQIHAEAAATTQEREAVAARIRQASPKYVPREWMRVA